MTKPKDIKISFRLMNVKIADTFDLGKDIKFTPLTKEDIRRKYPFDRWFSVPAQLLNNYRWYGEHNTEVTFTLKGKKVEEYLKIEKRDCLERIVKETFTFANIIETPVYASHSYGPGKKVFIKNISDLSFTPTLLTQNHIKKLQNSYQLISKIKDDSKLNLAFDRFMFANNKRNDHPHKINEANWDKIIDYTTAFETLLLSGKEELSYRFRLNGTSLISKVDKTEKRIIFDALKTLYELRSTIVHGGENKKIEKLARRFIEKMSLSRKDHTHDIGLLILITKQLNDWLIQIFEYLSNLEINKRPYNTTEIWEDWLWNNSV